MASLFEVDPIDLGAPRFNIAPTQPILTVRARRSSPSSSSSSSEPAEDSAENGGASRVARELAFARWGLIPWWAKPDEAKKIASRCIQARAETAARTPAFRDAFRRHRCLVVVDGFFEWKTLPDGRRVPHHVRRSEHGPFAIAALWDSWRPPAPEGGAPEATARGLIERRIESCAVLTTHAGGTIRDLHDRMPLVLPANEWNTWLGGTALDAARLLEQEQDQTVLDERARALVALPVSTWVNDVRHDDPRCIEPAPITKAPIEPGPGQIDFGFSRPSAATAPRRRR